ncbi:Uncharacterised protein [uncultured archaeon]|nr:Uncharacterised protein [uncultured archaeon]
MEIKISQQKRGIVSTISIVLMLVALLYLSSAVAHYSAMVRQANSGLADIASAGESSDAASLGVRRIAYGFGMRVSVSGNTTTFSQNLTALPAYRQAIAGWGSFISSYGGGKAEINESESSLPAYYVYSQNGSVLLVAVHNRSRDEFAATPAGASVSSYLVNATVLGIPSINITQASSIYPCSGPDALNFTVAAYDLLSRTGAQETVCVNRSADTRIAIDVGGAAANARASGGNLTFGYVPGRYVYLTVIAELGTAASEAELGRAAVRAQSGNVEKEERVLLG